MTLFRNLFQAIAARRVTLLVWAIVLLGIYAFAAHGRSVQKAAEATLSSPDGAVRDREVTQLVANKRLVDVLAASQNPNEDAKSKRNVASVALREGAADSVARLAVARQLPTDSALDTLFLLRKDSDQPVKDTATKALAALGGQSDANLKVLVARLSDGDPDIRAAATDALALVGGDKTAKLVDPLLQDAAAGDGAQSVMVKVGAPAVPYLLAHLSSPDAAFRQTIVGMLGTIAAPDAVPALNKEARTDTPTVRRVALVALANTVLSNYTALANARAAALTAAADPKAKPDDVRKAQVAVLNAQSAFDRTRAAEPPLVATLRDPNADSQARTQAALALGRIASPSAAAALSAALGDLDSRVRQSALQGAQSVGAGAVPALSAALRSGTPPMQSAAAQALGGIGTPDALLLVRPLLANAGAPAAVREGAVIGLGQSGSTAALPLLVAALGDPDGRVQSAASDALLTPALSTAAVPLLVASFGNAAPVPFNASQTLSRLGSLPLPALRAALSSASPATQTWAAVTLGQSGAADKDAEAQLTVLTHSVNPSVQYAAAQALTQMGGS